MQFDPPLQEAKLIKRYKRFLADVELADGATITVHCPNTGSMYNCQRAGSRIWYSTSKNAERKYPNTWEIIEVDNRHKVGINTTSANKLVLEAIYNNVIRSLQGYSNVRKEVPYGAQNSRIDILLEDTVNNQCRRCFVEVKNVSLGIGDGMGLFPDAVTKRGQKHMQELIEIASVGDRAVLLFCVQHEGINQVYPADDIDPEYGRLLRQAEAAGVEIQAYGTEFDIDTSTLRINQELSVII